MDCSCIDGKVIRYHDGRKIRCPVCLGRRRGQRREPVARRRPGSVAPVEVTRYGLRAAHPSACTCVDCSRWRVARQDPSAVVGLGLRSKLVSWLRRNWRGVGTAALIWGALLAAVAAVLLLEGRQL